MSARRSRRVASSGMTLIEVLVVLAILSLVVGLGVKGLRSLTRSELRGHATKLAGAIHYLFDRASMTGRVHRLVFDLEKATYWAEVTDDKIFMPREPETAESQALEEERAAEEEEEAQRAAENESEADAYDISRYRPKPFVPKRAKFEGFKDMALKPVEMKAAIVAGVFMPRLREPATSGKAYLYFFPLGQTEPALIHVADEERQAYYSLIVHPLTGQVKIHSGYLEPRLEQQYDDEGNALER
jgi:general secretion pathway protein H